MKNIFYELVEEAANGRVIIDGKPWPIGFNTTITKAGKEIRFKGENNLSNLVIRNEDVFLELLNEYLVTEIKSNRGLPSINVGDQKSVVKSVMAYLFANATTEDFLYPEYFIKRRIHFLNDQTFSDLDEVTRFGLNGHFLDSELEIKNEKQPIMLETPYRLDISLVKDGSEKELKYQLPSISYAIEKHDDERIICYIYAISNPQKNGELSEEEKQYTKKISRLLYKLNKGVSDVESEEYFEYKDAKSDYYPENISDVSPSFLLSLIIFLSLLQKKEIQDIKVVPYLPIRYLSRDLVISRIEDSKKREDLYERNNAIQDNVTNKFIRTFMRAAFHTSDLRITSYQYELDDYLHCYLSDEKSDLNNEILNDIANIIRGESPKFKM